MSTWDPTNPYGPGGAPTDATGNLTLSSGTSSATQDSLYGVSKRLAVLPVKITAGSDSRSMEGNQADRAQPTGDYTPPQLMDWQSTLALIYHMQPGERAAIQKQLYDAGFYPKSYYGKTPDVIVPGELDQGTLTAWRDAVEETVRSSTYDDKSGALVQAKSLQEVINERVSARAGDAQNAGATAVRLTNPMDLRQIAKQEGQTLLGRNPDPGFIDNFVAAYHGQEQQAYSPDATGNVTAPPDPRAFAQQMLRQVYPVDVKANDYLNVGNELVNALARPVNNPTAAQLPTTGNVNG